MASKITLGNTFDYWRQQFNALVDETSAANNLFKTPQEFGAVGDGINNDTAAFAAAQASGFPIYVPPGQYKLTQIFGSVNPTTGEVTSNFFGMGGVSWVNGFNGLAWLKFDLLNSFTGSMFSTVRVHTLTPTTDSHLTSKKYVDEKDIILTNSINSVQSTLSTEQTRIQNLVDTAFRKNVSNEAAGGLFVFKTEDNFVASNTSMTFTGLEVKQYQYDKDAMMRFHVGNDFAGYFGLAGDINDFAVGGYSFGANKHRILHKGNIDQFTPVSGNWWNNGFVKVKTTGVAEIGGFLDFHSQNSGTSDADARIGTSYDGTFLGFSKPGDSTCVNFDLVAGNVQLTSKTGAGGYHLILKSEALSVEDPAFINSPGFDGNDYCTNTMRHVNGGARFRGLFKKSGVPEEPALLLEGVKNDDGMFNWEWAKISVNAFGLAAGGIGTGNNANDNIFGVYDNGTARLVVKGDGTLKTSSTIDLYNSGISGGSDSGYGYRIHSYSYLSVPGLSFTNSSGTETLAIYGNHVHAPAASLAGYNISGTERLLTTKEYVNGTNSFSTNGYTKLPGGLVIQWGTFDSNVDVAQVVNFPTPFPNGCISVTTNVKVASVLWSINAYTWNANSFTVDRDANIDGIRTVNYIAIGY
jgi:hypothetical protein